MDNVVGFAGIGLLMVINIAMVAYSYGKMQQKIKDISGRLTRVEKILNGKK